MKALILTSMVFCNGLLPAYASPTDRWVAHEWGTFTSIQGAQGVQEKWNGVNPTELPKFVHGLLWPDGRDGNVGPLKLSFFAAQRMETPVIYFYSDEPRKVDVSVDFPRGTITEWFPQATDVNKLSPDFMRDLTPRLGKVHWDGVEVLPKSVKASGLPTDNSGNHYFAARETDANLLRMPSKKGPELERFLFYRGVASFEAPLAVTQQGDDAETIRLRNSGTDELRSLFVYRVLGNRAAWTFIPTLGAKEAQSTQLHFTDAGVSLEQFRASVVPEMKRALVAEGLFEPEAESMVNTWDSSWFNEPGMRVLYILPQAWTERILPLRIQPTPDNIVRVMVGRAELITPKTELALNREVTRYVNGDATEQAAAVANVRELALGRFAPVVLERVLGAVPRSKDFSQRAWTLISEATKPIVATRNKPLASK